MNIRLRMMIRSVMQCKRLCDRMDGIISLSENYTFPARKIHLRVRYRNMRSIMEYNRMHVFITEEEEMLCDRIGSIQDGKQ